MWSLRHLVVASALARALVVGLSGPPLALISGLLVWQLGTHVATRVRPQWSTWITLTDGAFLVLLASVGLPRDVVLLIVVAMLGWAATFRPAAAFGTFALAITALWCAGDGTAFGATDITVFAFALLGLVLVLRTTRMNMEARVSSDMQRLVAERVDAIVWEELPGGHGGFKVTEAAERLLGYPASEWADGTFVWSLVHPDDRSLADASFRGLGEGAVTIRMRRMDGSWRHMESRVNHVRDRRNRFAFLVGVLSDRTDQVEAEREALDFGHLVSTSPIGQLLVRCEQQVPIIGALNRSGQRVLGLDASSIGSRLEEHASPLAEIRQLIVDGKAQPEAASAEIMGRDGRVYQATARSVDTNTCSVDLLDITERVEASRRLHSQARQDHLTRLPNRRAFLEALEARVALSYKPPTSILLIDLDRFKDINDSLGHDTGDQLLLNIGKRIAHRSRDTDVVARLGGDEFALVLPDISPEDAERRAAALVDAISQPVAIGDLRLRVRASIGIASFPTDANDCTELVRCADLAMYHAKHRGTGVARYGAGIAGFGRDQLQLVSDLEQAIAKDQLALHHQPIFDIAAHRIVGSEALARWTHPQYGNVRPDVFVELAEVSGQMKEFTRWVIRQALRDAHAMSEVDPDFKVSVNLSVRNLYEPDFLSWLLEQLAEFEVAPERVRVEITETTIMDDQSAAIELVRALGDHGIRTWIDDFGTGHSSLARLRSLPVHGVKIDRSFVANAEKSAADRMILRGLVQLVRSMDLDVVAEGVETESALDFLTGEGCPLAQGFHLGLPMSRDDLEVQLRANLQVGVA